MKPTNYAEKIRRRKQFLKQNKNKPGVAPKKRRTLWILLFAGAIISLIAVPLIILISFALALQDELFEEWLNYQNIMVCIFFAVIVLSLVIIWIAPKIYVKSLRSKPLNEGQSEFDREKEKLKLEDDTRKTFAQLVGGAVFLFGILFTYNTFVLNREGQITDRFTKAVSQLGDEDVAVRLGALYALERIAKDSPKDHWTIIEILSAYVREKSPNKKPANTPETDQKKQSNSVETKPMESETVKTDVQAALTIIGRRIGKQDPSTFRNKIDLNNANLSGASFFQANLKSAILNSAKLYGTELIGADLTNATFFSADLTGAVFFQADLSGAALNNANLTNADFTRANLSNADVGGANLSGANFSVADLRSIKNLTYEQLETAIISEETKLPEDLEPRRQGLLDVSKKYLESRRQQYLDMYQKYQEKRRANENSSK